MKKTIALLLALMLMLSAYAFAWEEAPQEFIDHADQVMAFVNMERAYFDREPFTFDSADTFDKLGGFTRSYYQLDPDKLFHRCYVEGHNDANDMEIFCAWTDEKDEYVYTVDAAMSAVMMKFGYDCMMELYAIVDEHIRTITGARGDIYLMFPIESPLYEGAFFYMEKSQLSTGDEPWFYYASLVFPCIEECPCTSNAEEMIRKAEETYSEDPRVCHVCNGRRSFRVPTESGEICQLCEGSGLGNCDSCWASGYLYCPLFDSEEHKGSDCPYCGGEYIECKICDGAGRIGQCTYCNGTGAEHRSEQCATCEGTGRK